MNFTHKTQLKKQMEPKIVKQERFGKKKNFFVFTPHHLNILYVNKTMFIVKL